MKSSGTALSRRKGNGIDRLPGRGEIIEQVRGEGRQIAAILPIHYPRGLLRD